MLKTKQKHSWAVSGWFWGEKQYFLKYLNSFTALNKKGCLQQIEICLWICSFSNLLRKKNFLSISERLSEMVFFWLKREFFREVSRKCLKRIGKHSLAICCSFWGEKQFLLIFVPFFRFDQKQLLKHIQISSGFAPFQIFMKNKLSVYFSASFWDSHFLTQKRTF